MHGFGISILSWEQRQAVPEQAESKGMLWLSPSHQHIPVPSLFPLCASHLPAAQQQTQRFPTALWL